MKKVLIGLLVLAVAGGGVFAQEWQFNGDIFAGMMMVIEEGGEGPDLGLATNDPGTMRAQLRTRVQNADGTAGLDILFRADGGRPEGATTNVPGSGENQVFIPHGFGWLQFMDGMITLQGGQIDDAQGFNSFDRGFNTRMGEGLGLRTIIRPLGNNNLAFELGAYTTAFAGGRTRMWFDHNVDEARPGRPRRPELDVDQARFVFAVRYLEPDLFQVVAGLRNTSEVRSTGYHGWRASGADIGPGARIHTARDLGGDSRHAGLILPGEGRNANPSAAYVSFEYLGLAADGIHLAASAFFMNLEEFGDMGDMRFTLSAGHTGLVEGMDLRLNASFGLQMADWLRSGTQGATWIENPGRDAADGIAGHQGARYYEPSPWVWIWASVDYEVTDTIVPRLDLHYVMGGRTTRGINTTHNRNVAREGVTFDSEDTFLRIQPSVQLRVQSNTFVEFGAILNFCLGDNDTWRPGTLSTGTARDQRGIDNNGFNAGVYAVMRVSF